MAHNLSLMDKELVPAWHGISDMRGQLTNLQDICEFINAGNATITLVSKRTGERRTFKINQAKDKDDLFFVALMTGPDNENDYQYLGVLQDMEFRLTKKSRFKEDSLVTKAFSWFIGNLHRGHAEMLNQMEVWHEGRCGRCGRKLTVPESIAQGFGPECVKRVGQ